MNLRVQLNLLLPVWIIIWLTAATVYVDLAFLRAEPALVIVKSTEIQKDLKGHSKCMLGMQLPRGYLIKSTDTKTCRIVSKGEVLKLESSEVFDRWIALYDSENNKLSGELLENRIITDVTFIILALVMPLLLNFKLPERGKQVASFAFGLLIIGVIYFGCIFLQ